MPIRKKSIESFIIIWRRNFPSLNFSSSEDIGICRFSELVYKPTFEKQRGTPSHLRRYLLLYCLNCSTQDSVISYICKEGVSSWCKATDCFVNWFKTLQGYFLDLCTPMSISQWDWIKTPKTLYQLLPDCWDRIPSSNFEWFSLADPPTNDRLRFFFGLAFILAHVKRS